MKRATFIAGLVIWLFLVHGPTGQAQSPPATTESEQLQRRLDDLAAEVERLKQERTTVQPAGFDNLAAEPQIGVPPAPAADAAPDEPPVTWSPPAAPLVQTPASDVQMPPPSLSLPLESSFGNGFELRTKDGEFSMQFHNLTQFDARFYDLPSESIVNNTFVFPREWLIWSGHLTKPIEYTGSFAFGFDNVNLLDAFVNLHYDDRLQVKIGRYKTPFTYEFYTLPIQGLITPERSLYFNNFGMNRDVGVMLHGTVLEKHVDYAFGVFNGARNGFVDSNDSKDLMGYVNVKPFLTTDWEALHNLNLGGSFDYGSEDTVPLPFTLRTEVATSGNAILGIPFLGFESGVRERGQRALYTLHLAYYYEQLSLVSEWQGGYNSYDRNDRNEEIPVQGYYVQLGYFLTGEKVTFRNVVEPLRPFAPGQANSGPGAWELTTRFNYLDISDKVFDLGFADPTIWTTRVSSFDMGFNWYWNRYLKLMAIWEHSNFGDPVEFAPDVSKSFTNTYWTRLQLWF